MESAKQERKNLMKDMPVDKVASGGSWMSKHSQSRMGGSPIKMKEKGMMMKEEMKDSPAKMKSPMEKELVGKQKNLPEALKAKIEAAPESPANQNYNEVNVQDLQDMGKVKKNKKGKYVVNENATSGKDTLYIPKGTKSYTGKEIKVGKMIDESDYEDISKLVNSPKSKKDNM